jgi:tRNA-dihydrouridine synthase A
MMEWTDRHFRRFIRLISRHTLLYTEMVVAGALIHGDREGLLAFDPAEHPLALQLGGSAPAELVRCAAIAEAYGYDEVNLNVGCPSDRVQNGRFGACLMAEPDLVAHCMEAMSEAVSIPVTVKTRIGIDQQDSYEGLRSFVETVASAGCRTFIIHARKAWLNGLSPKENRDIPPLRYDVVRRIKQDFSSLEIILNGGITDLDQAQAHMAVMDGIMIGREAYHNPYLLAEVDGRFYHDYHSIPSREEVLVAYLPYVDRQLRSGVRLHSMTRHLLGLYHAVPGARRWRRYLSEHANRAGADARVILAAVDQPRRHPLIVNKPSSSSRMRTVL